MFQSGNILLHQPSAGWKLAALDGYFLADLSLAHNGQESSLETHVHNCIIVLEAKKNQVFRRKKKKNRWSLCL